jgi:VWFA-related protein
VAAEQPPASLPGDRSRVDQLLDRVSKGGAPLTDAELEEVLAATPHEEVKVSLILAPAVVVDHRGRPVTGLKVQDFEVKDQGKAQKITWFSEEQDRPFRMALLLDVSESMGLDEVRDRIAESLVPLAREVGIRDRLMLLTFSDQGVKKLSAWSDRPMAVVHEALETPTHGRTALVDALATAARQFPETPKERQAIILITDGMDNASELTPADVVDAARRVDIPVYVLLLGGAERKMQGKYYAGAPLKGLSEIAEETGGRSFLIDGPEAAVEAAAKVRDDLRHQYWLAFRPAKPPDGRFRPISINVKKHGAFVRTRAGYR